MWEDNIKMDEEIERSSMDWMIWFKIGTSGVLLWTQKWAFRFHQILGISWVTEQLAASHEGFSFMELDS
jgi:hypothetical protein